MQLVHYSQSCFTHSHYSWPVEDLNCVRSPREELETATWRDGRVDEGG